MRIRGIEIALHENEDLSNHIRRERDFFEPDILDYLKDYHPVQDTILDIGANIGNHSVYFANYMTYNNIICFEPIHDNYELLKINMAGYDNIGLVEAAVSSHTVEDFGMYIVRGNMGASKSDPFGDIRVKALSLDRMQLENVTLMKIDVEGHEPSVIEGAKDTIFRCHPLILIEDWERVYGTLLPDYVLEKGWPEHQTFLYRWRI